ncbi:SDR family NAD(P)-dependent oxidoreductase [Kribbella sandramycini]|uniref:SDR family NAD(P)-dependent oxidoreductase n=1 Tax=Kribbella sandramycini TaxID=60450 RepID=A0A7Y4P2P7_9ACTN|nr:SDR family NAD(P)-dependent oxidoreductase [Kribbella sandramycini]
MITGATQGLGRLVAGELARRGAELTVVGRSRAKVAELRRELDGPVGFCAAELSNLGEVRRAGETIAEGRAVDVLINNAGVHAFSQRITGEGFSEMVAVNYLAPWLLTSLLSPTTRVVTVASQASRHSGALDPVSDLRRTDDYTRRGSSAWYGWTKLLDIMFSQELARRLPGVGVNCCDPGFNTTGLGRELPFAGALQRILTAARIGDPRRGAAIITALAIDPAYDGVTGGYFARDGRPLTCPEPGRSEEKQRALWAETAATLQSVGA